MWTFLSCIAFIVLPMLLYLLAYLILSAKLCLHGHELVREFVGRHRAFHTIMALVSPARFFQQYLFGADIPLEVDTSVRVFWFVPAVPGILSRRIVVQTSIAVTYLVIMVLYIGMPFMRIR